MTRPTFPALLLASLAAACASPPPPATPSVPPAASQAPVVPAPRAAPSEPAAKPPPADVPGTSAPAMPAAPPRGPARGATKAPPVAKPPATVASAAPAARPAAPALDLKSLERRLKDTPAIGVMTKLSLKNQVDDLVERFRDYYEGRLRTSLAELRRPYDLLVMKVLALLQDGDPELAKAIHASRESLWTMLADREQFNRLTA